ncbi:hypothetical protein EVAR_95386_1 [Eumeta japonica]|uniref:Uncharacterized protein n=1 Tax=Eumeta variegata TaxID=151549 RepID=A0A4C2A282_EUMVA|nr:hypothetical protein EVAR_95386_1 [Eumeta japonica]
MDLSQQFGRNFVLVQPYGRGGGCGPHSTPTTGYQSGSRRPPVGGVSNVSNCGSSNGSAAGEYARVHQQPPHRRCFNVTSRDRHELISTYDNRIRNRITKCTRRTPARTRRLSDLESRKRSLCIEHIPRNKLGQNVNGIPTEIEFEIFTSETSDHPPSHAACAPSHDLVYFTICFGVLTNERTELVKEFVSLVCLTTRSRPKPIEGDKHDERKENGRKELNGVLHAVFIVRRCRRKEIELSIEEFWLFHVAMVVRGNSTVQNYDHILRYRNSGTNRHIDRPTRRDFSRDVKSSISESVVTSQRRRHLPVATAIASTRGNNSARAAEAGPACAARAQARRETRAGLEYLKRNRRQTWRPHTSWRRDESKYAFRNIVSQSLLRSETHLVSNVMQGHKRLRRPAAFGDGHARQGETSVT